MEQEFFARQVRNEHLVAVLAVIAACVGLVVGAWVGATLDATLGRLLQLVALAYGAYYAVVFWRLPRWASHLRVMQGVHVTLDVSTPALISLIDIRLVGSAYALTSTPALLTFLAVALSGLRMRRGLCFYAGGLAAAQYLAVYALAAPGLAAEPAGALPSLTPAFAVMHVAFLLLAGVVAAFVARVGRTTTRRVVGQVLERERVRSLFDEYVSPQAVDRVLAGEVALRGERRAVSVLFADIRGFTTTASALQPEEVVAWLNAYFGAVCEVIAGRGGVVNKMIGDGLLALFGAPEDDPEHARNAARAALEIVEAAQAVPKPTGGPTTVGVGVHAGEVVLGSIGSPSRRDYTVIGDTVNVASRVEGLTRELDADVLVTDTVLAAAPGLETEEVGPVRVKGREEPVVVHRLRRRCQKSARRRR